MNRKGESDKFRWNITIARPRLHDLLLPCIHHLHDFLHELGINVGAFLEGSGHISFG